jgi:hypothetical protein
MAKIKKEDLEILTSEQIRLSLISEDISILPSPIKEYVLEGKDRYEIGTRLNRVEKLLMLIITDRFVKGIL